LCAIVSAFPSQPTTTIIRHYGKFDKLPSLINVLDSNGYNSRWYYTGSVVFANTRSYLEAMGFDVIHSQEDLPGTQRTEWGAYDEELFRYYLTDSATFQEPFFHTIVTSTSHEPFDAPVDGGFPGKGEAQHYRNTVAYTDRCLGDFFDRARRLSSWKNTVYVVVADHGHYMPKDRNSYDLERHRIACLLLGGALRDDLRGATNATFTSHVDLAATLLGQLGLPHDRFVWSKDIFDPHTSKFAFYTFDNGFGYTDPVQAVVFDAVRGKPVLWRDSTATASVDSAALRNGKALLQIELERYLELDQ
jgi:phosphoglycerol transferase MdoB-like AlkP superfamily enzyme